MWLVLWILPLCSAYTISYFDCTAPSKVNRFSYQTICNRNNQTNNPSKKYQLLQRVDSQSIGGHSCSIIRSTFLLYCGAYSHSKIMKIPQTEINENLEPEACRRLIYQRRYTAPDGQVHTLKLQEETIIESQDLGAIHETENAVSCEGQEISINGHIIKDALQISQIKVTLLQEKYLNTGSRMEVVSDHIRLPRECKKSVGGCITAHRTYIWTAPASKCNLERIQDLDLAAIGEYLVDHHRKVVLRPGDVFPAPGRCPSVKLIATEYEGFFLAPAEKEGFSVLSDAVEIDIFARSLTDYALFEAEQLMNQNSEAVQADLCRNQFVFNDDRIHRLEDNSFASRKGDIIYLFSCTRRGGVVKQEKGCYRDIPVEGGGFVNSLTRVFQNNSSPTVCNRHFPLEVHTKEGWVSISPDIKEVETPEERSLKHYQAHHEDLAKGGLYTATELISWRQHLEDGSYSDAILKTISYGACVNEGTCPSGEGSSRINFDLTRLNPLQHLEDLGIWKRAENWLTKHVAILCLLVLLLESFKFLATALILVTTFLREGTAGLQAILVLTFCSSYTKYRKIRKRGKRLATEDPVDQLPMRPMSASDAEN